MKIRLDGKLVRYLSIAIAGFLLLITLFYASNENALIDILNSQPGESQVEGLPPSEYMLAKVEGVKEIENSEGEAAAELGELSEEGNFTEAKLTVLYSPQRLELNGKEITATLSKSDRNFYDRQGELNLSAGDKVIVLRSVTILPPLESAEGGESVAAPAEDKVTFTLIDRQRLPAVLILLFGFLVFLFAVSRRAGVQSVLGLIATFVILVVYIIPSILNGNHPIIVTLVGAFWIALASIYLAHGFNRKTTLSLVSMALCIFVATFLGLFAVKLTSLLGLASEEALYLQLGEFGAVNLQGVLLGAIIIGALGVLDDVATAQTAAVIELKRANPKWGFAELFSSANRIGREHITSLVNTLVLAYASAAFPLFILLVADQGQPLWVTLNSELIVEEIVRSLVGSAVLILAVPVSSFVAAYYYAQGRASADSDLLSGSSSSKPSHNHLHAHSHSHSHPHKH